MLYRNLLANQEFLRSLPIDGAVLMGGCDKTTPGLLMGAISVNLPAIFLPAGPMLRGNWNGQPLGSGTDIWKFWAERCAGSIGEEEWNAVEGGIARSPGFCMTMGTASTMTALAEAMGMTLPGASSIPAPDSNHVRLALDTGNRIVEMVWEDLKPADILDLHAFESTNCRRMAIGGSTARLSISSPRRRRAHRTAPPPLRRNLRPRTRAGHSPSGEFLMVFITQGACGP
jgi:dihydroxy-acid dehydratase